MNAWFVGEIMVPPWSKNKLHTKDRLRGTNASQMVDYPTSNYINVQVDGFQHHQRL